MKNEPLLNDQIKASLFKVHNRLEEVIGSGFFKALDLHPHLDKRHADICNKIDSAISKYKIEQNVELMEMAVFNYELEMIALFDEFSKQAGLSKKEKILNRLKFEEMFGEEKQKEFFEPTDTVSTDTFPPHAMLALSEIADQIRSDIDDEEIPF